MRSLTVPFALLARLLARLAALGVAGIVLRGARRRQGGMPPPWRTPGQRPAGPGRGGGPDDPDGDPLRGGIPDLEAARRAAAAMLQSTVEGVRLATRLAVLLALLAVLAVALTAGTTTAVLGPRWLGAVLLAVALLAAAGAALEVRLIAITASARRRRGRLRVAAPDEEPSGSGPGRRPSP